jgi:hypothetical protein
LPAEIGKITAAADAAFHAAARVLQSAPESQRQLEAQVEVVLTDEFGDEIPVSESLPVAPAGLSVLLPLAVQVVVAAAALPLAVPAAATLLIAAAKTILAPLAAIASDSGRASQHAKCSASGSASLSCAGSSVPVRCLPVLTAIAASESDVDSEPARDSPAEDSDVWEGT